MSYLQRILSKELMICLVTASTLDLSSNPTHAFALISAYAHIIFAVNGTSILLHSGLNPA